MAELITDCPRCAANRITFDITGVNPSKFASGWAIAYEAFAVCRMCHGATIFQLDAKDYDTAVRIQKTGLAAVQGTINDFVYVKGFISIQNHMTVRPPAHVPADIAKVFEEGATCMAARCYNAAAAMFRLCLDLATKGLLPEQDGNGLNSPIRRNLGLRLPWLFDKNLIPRDLEDLSTCIKDNGNDGAHDGTLSEADAADILDFTVALLERMFTEPERLRQARLRREQRRAS